MPNSESTVIAFRKPRQVTSIPSTSQTKTNLLNDTESTLSVEKKEDGFRRIQSLLKNLNDVFAEARSDDWEGEGAEAISDAAYYNATKVLAVLPFDLPQPDIIPDNDGYLEFEWANGGKNFSIYVTDTNLILYAGYYGEDNRLSGRFNYEGCIPGHVELLSKEVFREDLR